MSDFPRVKPIEPPPQLHNCNYPRSFPTNAPIGTVLQNLVAGGADPSSFHLDTQQSMGGGVGKGENHAQGIARTHQLSNGEVYWFLAYSEIGGEGQISTYVYDGKVVDAHIVSPEPGKALTVAPMQQRWLNLVGEDHPSDIAFLPDINNADAGYLFITEEYQLHQVTVYYWKAGAETLQPVGVIGGFPRDTKAGFTGPQFVFIDLVGDTYYLGIASENWGWGRLFEAEPSVLFPNCSQGGIDVGAFHPVPQVQIASRPVAGSVNLTPPQLDGLFVFPILGSPSQVKLVCDSANHWYLLAFRSVPNDSPNGTDYIDAYPVKFQPFSISSPNQPSIHITFPPGDTSFASTGTHYVNSKGQLMVSTSFRWAEEISSSGVGYVSRVDELLAL